MAVSYTHLSVSPLDCMGCGECVTVCPMAAKGALKMVPRESQEAEQPVGGKAQFGEMCIRDRFGPYPARAEDI